MKQILNIPCHWEKLHSKALHLTVRECESHEETSVSLRNVYSESSSIVMAVMHSGTILSGSLLPIG